MTRLAKSEAIEVVDFDTLVDTLMQKEGVLFGEDHNEIVIVQNQLELLKWIYEALKSDGRTLSLALEHFNTAQKDYFSREAGKVTIYDQSTRQQAMDHLASLYINSPKEFKTYISPLIDFSIENEGVTIYPIADPSMKNHRGSWETKRWNEHMSNAIKDIPSPERFLFAIMGKDHITDPSYDRKFSVPSLLMAERKSLDIAILFQEKPGDAPCSHGIITPVYGSFCDTYQIDGRLSGLKSKSD